MSSSRASDACAVAASVFMLAAGRAAEQKILTGNMPIVAACNTPVHWPSAARLFGWHVMLT